MELDNIYQDGAEYSLIKGMENEYYIKVGSSVVSSFIAISDEEAKARFESFVRASL